MLCVHCRWISTWQAPWTLPKFQQRFGSCLRSYTKSHCQLIDQRLKMTITPQRSRNAALVKHVSKNTIATKQRKAHKPASQWTCTTGITRKMRQATETRRQKKRRVGKSGERKVR